MKIRIITIAALLLITSNVKAEEDYPLYTCNTFDVFEGDTIFEAMRVTGAYWKDIIRHNEIKAPYSLKPGTTILIPCTKPLPTN